MLPLGTKPIMASGCTSHHVQEWSALAVVRCAWNEAYQFSVEREGGRRIVSAKGAVNGRCEGGSWMP